MSNTNSTNFVSKSYGLERRFHMFEILFEYCFLDSADRGWLLELEGRLQDTSHGRRGCPGRSGGVESSKLIKRTITMNHSKSERWKIEAPAEQPSIPYLGCKTADSAAALSFSR